METSCVQRPKGVEGVDDVKLNDFPCSPVEAPSEAIWPRGSIKRELLHSRLDLFFREASIKPSQIKLWKQMLKAQRVQALERGAKNTVVGVKDKVCLGIFSREPLAFVHERRDEVLAISVASL